MIKKSIYVVVLVLIMALSHPISADNAPTQQPEVYRVFDSDFKERYNNDKFNYEGKKVVGNSRTGSGDYEDYKKGDTRTRETKDKDDIIINLGPFGFLFYIILAIAIVYLVYVLLSEGGTGFFAFNKNKAIERYEDISAENIEHADINALINEAEKKNDYRLAIRYYYLLVLKTLSINEHIKYEDDKTNAQYLNELKEKPFSKGFNYVLYLYNYIWYGKFSLEAAQYTKAKANFTTLLKQVKK